MVIRVAELRRVKVAVVCWEGAQSQVASRRGRERAAEARMPSAASEAAAAPYSQLLLQDDEMIFGRYKKQAKRRSEAQQAKQPGDSSRDSAHLTCRLIAGRIIIRVRAGFVGNSQQLELDSCADGMRGRGSCWVISGLTGWQLRG